MKEENRDYFLRGTTRAAAMSIKISTIMITIVLRGVSSSNGDADGIVGRALWQLCSGRPPAEGLPDIREVRSGDVSAL